MGKSCEYQAEHRMIRDKIVIWTNKRILQRKLFETIKMTRNFEIVEIN